MSDSETESEDDFQNHSDSESDDDFQVQGHYNFWSGVPIDEFFDREQLETQAIRTILDRVGRSNLPAVPNSFNSIANVATIVLSSDLRVIPECINLLTGLRDLILGYCELNRDGSIPDTLWELTGLERLNLY